MTGLVLSFIIPTLNEEEHLGAVLDRITEELQGRLAYEVIVVDNGSVDRTVHIAEEKGAKTLILPGCTISTLRNEGVQAASADVLVFLDADVYLGKGWGELIPEVIEKLNRSKNIITGSIYGISLENNWIERSWFAPRVAAKEMNYINGGHLILHRELFSAVGGFSPKYETGEDYEFCARARRMQAQIVNDPRMHVIHAGYPKSVWSFFTRERWHARGDCASLRTLLSSKPGIISLLNLLVFLFCVCGFIISQLQIFVVVYLLFLLVVSAAASIRKCQCEIGSILFFNTFLYAIYFTARTVAIVDVLLKPLTKAKGGACSVVPY